MSSNSPVPARVQLNIKVTNLGLTTREALMEPRAITSVCKVGCCLSHGQLTMPCGLPAQFHPCYCVVGTLEPTRPCPPQMLCRIQIAQSRSQLRVWGTGTRTDVLPGPGPGAGRVLDTEPG